MRTRKSTDKNNWRKIFEFFAKRFAGCCAHNFGVKRRNSTTSRLRGIFPHAHVAVKNDPNFLRLRAQTLRGFLDK